MALIDLIYPKHCPVCLEVLPPGKKLICDPCKKKIRYALEPLCLKCGRPMEDEGEEYCSNCKKRMPSFEKGIIWAEYSSKYIQRMLARVKYQDDPQILDYPCRDFALRSLSFAKETRAEALIPVPVHKSREKIRGYNQAGEIAERLALYWGIPADHDFLLRTKRTEAQKKLSDLQRILNLQQVFSVNKKKPVYQCVILVDDILTTGSTAEACSRVLKASGVKKVYFAALAAGRGR